MGDGIVIATAGVNPLPDERVEVVGGNRGTLGPRATSRNLRPLRRQEGILRMLNLSHKLFDALEVVSGEMDQLRDI